MLSISDDILYLQPVTSKVYAIEGKMDVECVGYIMGCQIQTGRDERASYVVRNLPLRSHTQKMVKAIAKLPSAETTSNPTDRELTNWEAL